MNTRLWPPSNDPEEEAKRESLRFSSSVDNNARDQMMWGNWNHGWTNAADIVLAPGTQDPENYTNPNGWDPATGAGICPKYEQDVQTVSASLAQEDWSWTPGEGSAP